MGFVANFICFPTVQKIENHLRFDKVTESFKVGTFLRHNVYIKLFSILSGVRLVYYVSLDLNILCAISA